MILKALCLAVFACTTPIHGRAQRVPAEFPRRALFARHTFFDFGPPFNFYEVLSLEEKGPTTEIKRLLVTPPGIACIQPAQVKLEETTINETLFALMLGKNPCDIPEKELRKEQKRCKKCLVFRAN